MGQALLSDDHMVANKTNTANTANTANKTPPTICRRHLPTSHLFGFTFAK